MRPTIVRLQVQLQYNYPAASFVSLHPAAFAAPGMTVTDAELHGPLGHVVDAFPHIQRSLVHQVYVEARRDVQETIERLMDLDIDADTVQPSGCSSSTTSHSPASPQDDVNPLGLHSPGLAMKGLPPAEQGSTGQPLPLDISGHLSEPAQVAPCAHLGTAATERQLSGVFTASRGYWPSWSDEGAADRHQHQAYVLTEIQPLASDHRVLQPPELPAFKEAAPLDLLGDQAPPCPDSGPFTFEALPVLSSLTPSSSSTSPDRPTLGLKAYQPPPPPSVLLTAPQSAAESEIPTEEQSMEFLQGMFPEMDAAMVEDVFLTANRDVDAAMCHLMQMQMKDEPGMGSLPSLPDTSQASDDGTDPSLPPRQAFPFHTRPTSPDGSQIMSPADSDYTYKDLNLEQKVKRLQKEHPGVAADYLARALEASNLDLSLATALVLTAEDGSPRTPDDAEAKRAQEEADAAIAAALQQRSEQEQTDHDLAFHMQHGNRPPPPPHGFTASPSRVLRVSPAKSHTSDGTSSSGHKGSSKGDAAARRRIKALKRTFPDVSEEWAGQVLLACNGDLAQAKQAILDSGMHPSPGQSLGLPITRSQATQMLGFQSPLRNCEVVREETDVLYKRVREKVRHHKDRQYHHVHEMRMAMHRGERDLARKLEQRAKQEGHLAAIAQQEAAETTAMAMNSHNVQQFQVDLHGLHVEEALKYTCTFLEQGWGFCLATKLPALVKLITGRGNHSEGNQPKILPAVKKFLVKEGIDFVAAPGCFSVGFRHAGNGQAYAHYNNVVDSFPRHFAPP